MIPTPDPLDSDLPFILGDAEGEEAQLRALENASEAIVFPLEARVRGESVEVLAFTRSERVPMRIMARVRAATSLASEPAEIELENVEFGESTIARRFVGAYREWLERRRSTDLHQQIDPQDDLDT